MSPEKQEISPLGKDQDEVKRELSLKHSNHGVEAVFILYLFR